MPEIEYPKPPLSDGVVMLRPGGEQDVTAITAACQDPLIPRFTKVPHHYRPADARAWREEGERQRRQGITPICGVRRCLAGRVAGLASRITAMPIYEFEREAARRDRLAEAKEARESS